MIEVTVTVNGEDKTVDVAPETTLLSLLREWGLTGTKLGCDEGDCGACTVLLDGKSVNGCLVLAGRADGCSVTTVEGLAADGRLHPLQEAFEQHASLQCGFCGPGMLMSAKELLDANPKPSRSEIRIALSGNLCRCTGYVKIVDAVMKAGAMMAARGDQSNG